MVHQCVVSIALLLGLFHYTSAVIANIEQNATQDYVIIPNGLTLKKMTFSSTTAFAWTDDSSASYLFSAELADLDALGSIVPVRNSSASFRSSGDFADQAGVTSSNNTLFVWGSNIVYRFYNPNNLSLHETVSFPTLILPRTGFLINNNLYTPQFTPSGTLPSQLFSTDLAKFTQGFASSTSMIDLAFPEMMAAKVDTSLGYVVAVYSGGQIEIRTTSAVSQVLATVTIGNATTNGVGFAMQDLFVDSANKLVYFTGSQESLVSIHSWHDLLDMINLL